MADLATFLLSLRRKPFVFGQCDCILSCADWFIANHPGVSDPAAPWRGTYSTDAEMRAVLQRDGQLPRIMARMGRALGAKRTTDPQPGDVGCLRVDGQWWAAILAPTGRWWIKCSDPGVFVSPQASVKVVAAWKVA